jgi:hypothetical protein
MKQHCARQDQHLRIQFFQTQYRMSEEIVSFPNKFMYKNRLRTDHSKAGTCSDWLLPIRCVKTSQVREELASLLTTTTMMTMQSDLSNCFKRAMRSALFGGAFLWVHSGKEGDSGVNSGGGGGGGGVSTELSFYDFFEEVGDKHSIYNTKEAKLVKYLVRFLVDGISAVVKSEDIVVIAMYGVP